MDHRVRDLQPEIAAHTQLAHLIHRDFYWDDLPHLVLCPCVVSLAEVHNVETSSTKSWTNRGSGVGLSSLNGKLDLLGHCINRMVLMLEFCSHTWPGGVRSIE